MADGEEVTTSNASNAENGSSEPLNEMVYRSSGKRNGRETVTVPEITEDVDEAVLVESERKYSPPQRSDVPGDDELARPPTEQGQNDVASDIDTSLVQDGADGGSSPRPSSKATSRIPKISSRAAFTRTPSHMLTPSIDGDGLPTQDETGVLITELQASDTEDLDDTDLLQTTIEKDDDTDGESRVEEKSEGDERSIVSEPCELPLQTALPVDTVEVRVTDEDYDTDLEVEEQEDEEVVKAYYKTCCEQLGLIPVEYFLRHIRNQNIRMRYRGLGPDATRAIALSLKDNITLERLDIGGNWIGAEGARFMSRLLEENDYITDLVPDIGMAENKMGSEGGMYVAKMMNINGGLRRLDIAGNELDDKCSEALSSAIENNKYLRELDLSHNRFSEVGAEFLGPAISANENLDVLDLSWNHLRERGGVAVAKGIKENVRLKICDLSWNGLDAKGGLAIADALQVNQSLLELDISGNRLTLEVAIKMAKVLTTNDTIKILKMGNNLITSAGAIALASAVNNTDSCELEELDLTDVAVEYEFLRTIEDIKTNRPNFRVKHGPLMRAGNTIDDLTKQAIDIDRIKKEPVVILKEHIIVNDMRLLDILKRYDEDGSLSVSAEDFVSALEELAVPYDKKRLEESVQKFAATATGKIYFGSFVKDDYNKSKTAVK